MIEQIKNLFGCSRTFGMARSPKWEGVRNFVIKSQPFCSVCNTNKKLEVHHIKPFHIDPSLELSLNNMIVLCRDHHYFFGHFNDWSSFNPNIIQDSKDWFNKIKTRT